MLTVAPAGTATPPDVNSPMTLFGGEVLVMLGQYGPPAITGAGVGSGVVAETAVVSGAAVETFATARTAVAVGLAEGEGDGSADADGDGDGAGEGVAVRVAGVVAVAVMALACAGASPPRPWSKTPPAASARPIMPSADQPAACLPGVENHCHNRPIVCFPKN